jgi:Xaa-Pro aminopeptidase
MAAERIDLLVALPQSVPADVHYLAHEHGAVLFPLEGEPAIILGGEDSHLAVDRQGWIEERSSATSNGSSRVPYGRVVADRLRSVKPGTRVGLVGLAGNAYTNVRLPEGYLTHTSVVQMLAALGDAHVVDGTAAMARARHVRSAAEVDAFRTSVALAESAASAIGDAFVVGASQADAYRAGMQALLEPGVTELNLAWCPGTWGRPRPRLVGPPPGDISDGLCVAAEIFPGMHGYVAQVAQPLIAGEPAPEQVDAFELNIAAFEATCGALRPGATWREVRRAALAVADGTRWQVCFLLHSGPDGPLFVPNERNDDMLDAEVQRDAVFVCKPHVHPAGEPYLARSHDVAWGDTIVVTPGGAERLGTRAQSVTLAGPGAGVP